MWGRTVGTGNTTGGCLLLGRIPRGVGVLGSPWEPLSFGRAEPGMPRGCAVGCQAASPSPFPAPAVTRLLSKVTTTPPDIPLAEPFPNIFLSSSSPFHRHWCCWPGLCFPR